MSGEGSHLGRDSEVPHWQSLEGEGLVKGARKNERKRKGREESKDREGLC